MRPLTRRVGFELFSAPPSLRRLLIIIFLPAEESVAAFQSIAKKQALKRAAGDGGAALR